MIANILRLTNFFITHFSFGLELDFNFTNLWSNSSGNGFNYNYKFIQNTQIDNIAKRSELKAMLSNILKSFSQHP